MSVGRSVLLCIVIEDRLTLTYVKKPSCVCSQSCLILFDCMDGSLPGSSVLGVFQSRIPESVAISSSRGPSQPGIKLTSPVSPALQADSFFFPFIFISWRLITLQYCSGFCHTLT